jgi:hypothetical protein
MWQIELQPGARITVYLEVILRYKQSPRSQVGFEDVPSWKFLLYPVVCPTSYFAHADIWIARANWCGHAVVTCWVISSGWLAE